MSEVLAMGGHAAFIWPAYAVAAAVMIGLLAASIATMRQREAMVDSLRANRGQDGSHGQ